VGARVIHLQRARAGELKDSPQMASQWQKHLGCEGGNAIQKHSKKNHTPTRSIVAVRAHRWGHTGGDWCERGKNVSEAKRCFLPPPLPPCTAFPTPHSTPRLLLVSFAWVVSPSNRPTIDLTLSVVHSMQWCGCERGGGDVW
jgi:hypothetical protein